MSRKEHGSANRARGLKQNPREGPNWVLVAGGALLTTLSIRIACKLRRHFEARKTTDSNAARQGNKIFTVEEREGSCKRHLHLNCSNTGDRCYFCNSGKSDVGLGEKKAPVTPSSKDADTQFPLVKIPSLDVDRDCYEAPWPSSPERVHLQLLTLHHSNSSDSLSISETGSDVYSKRAVLKKLRQQLKRRDEMIMEMQTQVSELQSSLQVQATQTSSLQSQLRSAQGDLFESQLEIQRLRKVIADHCLGKACNGLTNGYHENQNTLHSGSESAILISDTKPRMLLIE